MKRASRIAAGTTGLALTLALLCSPSFAGSLERGPYLQNQTETAVTVQWVTLGEGSTGELDVTGVGTFSSTTEGDSGYTYHKARATGLSPDTDYAYLIKTDGTAQTSSITFHTNKPKGAANPSVKPSALKWSRALGPILGA